MQAILTAHKKSWWLSQRKSFYSIPVSAITRTHTDPDKKVSVYVVGNPTPYKTTIKNEELQNAFKAADITPIVMPYPWINDITRQGTTHINPNFVNYIFVPNDNKRRLTLHLHGGTRLEPTSGTHRSILDTFTAAQIDLVPVTLSQHKATAHIIPSNVKAITDKPRAPFYTRWAALYRVTSDLLIGTPVVTLERDVDQLKTATSPRHVIIFADNARIHVPNGLDCSTLLAPHRARYIPPPFSP